MKKTITPHLVQYQGSKRLIAPFILKYFPRRFNRLIEPFAGVAAISIATAVRGNTNSFYLNDINKPLMGLLEAVINSPSDLIRNYEKLWLQQFKYNDQHTEHFYKVRNEFNEGNTAPENMLYLLARCVKGSIRYCKNGRLNQSPDKRRHGTNPKNIAKNVNAISNLLKNKTIFSTLDYREVFELARQGDILYMDPPYQGVTNVRDHRYLSGVDFNDFVDSLEVLNKKNIDYIISYDGTCGKKVYGEKLPKHLMCKKILIHAGISSQSTLLGKKEITLESLYISKNIASYLDFDNRIGITHRQNHLELSYE